MFAMFSVQLDLILIIGTSPCSTIANLGQRTRASSRKLSHRWQPSPAAAAAEVFPGAEYRGVWAWIVYLDVSLSPCGILVEETKRKAAYPLFWQGTEVRFFFLNSPQTHHPEKPLFPTTGSPREHYR